MKTQIRTLFILVLSAILSYGCDEESTGLLEDLAQGKMVVIVNDGEKVVLDCTFMQYGEGEGLTGEVFFTGVLMEGQEHKHFSIMYGSYTNSIPLTAKTYKSDGGEGNHMYVNCWAGNSDDGAVMTVKIISVTEAAIKGEFEGEVKNENGVKSNVKGAFWALRQAE